MLPPSKLFQLSGCAPLRRWCQPGPQLRADARVARPSALRAAPRPRCAARSSGVSPAARRKPLVATRPRASPLATLTRRRGVGVAALREQRSVAKHRRAGCVEGDRSRQASLEAPVRPSVDALMCDALRVTCSLHVVALLRPSPKPACAGSTCAGTVPPPSRRCNHAALRAQRRELDGGTFGEETRAV